MSLLYLKMFINLILLEYYTHCKDSKLASRMTIPNTTKFFSVAHKIMDAFRIFMDVLVSYKFIKNKI